MINASNEGICVEFWIKKTHNLGLLAFKLPASTKNLLRQQCNLQTIIFEDFSIWIHVLVYRNKFHIYFRKYWVAMKYRWICKFLILSESPSLSGL